MPPLSPALADKNSLEGKGYKLAVEFLYNKTDPNPALWQYYRVVRYDLPLTVIAEQLGNPSVTQTITFDGGSPVGNVEWKESTSGEVTEASLVLPGAARAIASIGLTYRIKRHPGRLGWIHPDFTGEGFVQECRFYIKGAHCVDTTATIQVTGIPFDLYGTQLPRGVVTTEEFPGLAGSRSLFLR